MKQFLMKQTPFESSLSCASIALTGQFIFQL